MSNNDAAVAADPQATERAAVAAMGAQNAKPVGRGKTKAVKEAKPKGPRNSLHNLLWSLFARNRSYEGILAEVAEKFPKSKFNARQVMHFNYYRAKYNMEAKANGTEPTTSTAPAKERVIKAKAEPKAKSNGKIKAVEQGA